MRSILHRYILKELLGLFSINIAFFSFIFLMTQLLEITNYIVNYNVGLKEVICLLAYNMPFFLEFIIPMAVMISVLLTFLQMSADKEIIALKASGISLYKLLPPVLVFSLVGCLLTAFMAIWGLPHGRLATKELLYDLAASHLDIGLKPRQFIHSFKDMVLYVHEMDTGNKELKHIFIEDRRSAQMRTTIIAKKGSLVFQPDKRLIILKLMKGTIHQVDVTQGSAHAIKFGVYNLRLDMTNNAKMARNKAKDEEEMSLGELRQYLKTAEKKNDQYYLTLMEWHKKFSLPSACIMLAIIGVPLGIQVRVSKRSFGIGLGLGFFLLYYLMLSLGWVFGEAGVYPPVIGMWAPNIVTLAIGVILLNRAAKEKTLPWPSWRGIRSWFVRCTCFGNRSEHGRTR